MESADSQDFEVLKKMEDEHLRLQRQVRQIQADRSQAMSGVHPQFRRQDQLLFALKDEYLDLTLDLKTAQSGASKKRDRKMKSDLKKALMARKQCESEGNGGVILMDQYEQLLQRQKKEMLQLKKLVGQNVGQIEQRRSQSEHRLMSTENRLENANLRFNMVQYENKLVREEIDRMLKDRTIFNLNWAKTLVVLKKGKKFLHDLFESSTLAYDQRDEWVGKLKSASEKGKIDQMLQMHEMRDLKKTFDHEMKLYHFFAKKGLIRVNKREEQRQLQLKIKNEDGTMAQLVKYMALLDEITDYTELSEEHTMDAFELMERDIFAVYNLLTMICAENEILRRDMTHLIQVVDDRKDWNENKEEQRQANIRNLEATIAKKNSANEILQAAVNKKIKLLQSAMDQIDGLFRLMGCSNEPFMQLLGDKRPSLAHQNLTLRVISEKVKEYVELVYYYERQVARKSEKTTTSRLKKYTVHAEQPRCWSAPPLMLLVPADPCPTCVETRWLSRVSDAMEWPLTKKETLQAIVELSSDPAFLKSDRVHPLTDCRLPGSRAILLNRYMQ